MKTIYITLFVFCITGIFCEAKPRLIHSEDKVNRDGVQYRKLGSHFFFHQSEMTYHYLLNPENKLVQKKWGDFELGLRHGRIQNGSWCMWNFFSCIMRDKTSLTEQGPAENVCLIPFPGGVIAELVWPGMTMKMVQLETSKEWLFMEITVKETPAVLRLRAWPGGTKAKKTDGLIRRLMTPQQDLTLNEQKLEYPSSSGGLALYNRNYSERNGNFLVFEVGKYEKTSASASNMVSLDFVPKAGEKVFHFALGYFLNEDPQESCGRFLKERLPNIAALLKQIQWTPKADFSAFSRNVDVIEHILAKSNLTSERKMAFERELRQCQERFRKAEKARDIPGAYNEIEVSEQLRSRVGEEALSTLR